MPLIEHVECTHMPNLLLWSARDVAVATGWHRRACGCQAVLIWPPSMMWSAPVMLPASGEAR